MPSYPVADTVYENVAVLPKTQVWCGDATCSDANKKIANGIFYLAPQMGFIERDYYDANWTLTGIHLVGQSCTRADSALSCS